MTHNPAPNAVERMRTRRAAQVLGIPCPDYAAPLYAGAKAHYDIAWDDDGPMLTPQELTIVRRLCEEEALEVPTWAQRQPSGPKRAKHEGVAGMQTHFAGVI